jgi:urease beta subunit
MIPGEYILAVADIVCNEGRQTVQVKVINTGDRPVQIGSHFHFFEVNRQLQFERKLAFGMRLNIPSGTAVRFEPGEEKRVELVAYGGNRKVFGFSNMVNGDANDPDNKAGALKRLDESNFKNTSA